MFETIFTVSCLTNVFQSFNLQRVIYYYNIINLLKTASTVHTVKYIHQREKRKSTEMDVRTHNSDVFILTITWVRYRVNPNGIYSCIDRLYLRTTYSLTAFYDNNIIHPILFYWWIFDRTNVRVIIFNGKRRSL